MDKKCTKCGLIKPLSEFYKTNATKDGYTYNCKECCKDRQRKRLLKIKAKEKHKKCPICGQFKPVSDFFKPKNNTHRSMCRECHIKGVPDDIKKISTKYGIPSTLLMGWSDSAVDCYEIGCKCRNCFIKKNFDLNCKMKKVVRILLKLYGKPVLKEFEDNGIF